LQTFDLQIKPHSEW